MFCTTEHRACCPVRPPWPKLDQPIGRTKSSTEIRTCHSRGFLILALAMSDISWESYLQLSAICSYDLDGPLKCLESNCRRPPRAVGRLEPRPLANYLSETPGKWRNHSVEHKIWKNLAKLYICTQSYTCDSVTVWNKCVSIVWCHQRTTRASYSKLCYPVSIYQNQQKCQQLQQQVEPSWKEENQKYQEIMRNRKKS